MSSNGNEVVSSEFIKEHMGSKAGSQGYDVAADVNLDGVIDSFDLTARDELASFAVSDDDDSDASDEVGGLADLYLNELRHDRAFLQQDVP